MRGNETLANIAAILHDTGGYFTFRGEDGEELMVIRKSDVPGLDAAQSSAQLQLSLPPPPPGASLPSADELLERINRDIALYHEAQAQSEEFDDLAIPDEEEKMSPPYQPAAPLPPPRRVRFEPLRGDLPPELQE